MILKHLLKNEAFYFIEQLKNNKIKIVMATMLLSTVTVSAGFAEENAEDGLSAIYHVYDDTAYLGTVSNEQTIENVLKKKEQQVSAQYKDLEIEVGSNITVVPEQVFTVVADDTSTAEKLEQAADIQADAYTLQIGDQVVAYVKDRAAYTQALRLLKLQYVTEEELTLYETTIERVPLTQHNQTKILDISFTAPVTGTETKVLPNQILTPEQVVTLLMQGTIEPQIYTVQPKDGLYAIARAHSLSLAQLLALNPGISEDTILKEGQTLNVTVKKPLLGVKVVKEKYRVESIDFNQLLEEDATMPIGQQKIIQQGQKGEKQVLYMITSENGIRTGKSVVAEAVVAEPVNHVAIIGTKVIPSRGTGTFAWPAVGGYISSYMGERFGRYHYGIDIARPSERTIKATDNGTVTAVGWAGTYGNRVIIDHNNGYQTLYAHLSSISVSVGQVVEQGAPIGIMGSTGRSTGIHLHFEVELNGLTVNPVSVLQ